MDQNTEKPFILFAATKHKSVVVREDGRRISTPLQATIERLGCECGSEGLTCIGHRTGVLPEGSEQIQ